MYVLCMYVCIYALCLVRKHIPWIYLPFSIHIFDFSIRMEHILTSQIIKIVGINDDQVFFLLLESVMNYFMSGHGIKLCMILKWCCVLFFKIKSRASVFVCLFEPFYLEIFKYTLTKSMRTHKYPVIVPSVTIKFCVQICKI